MNKVRDFLFQAAGVAVMVLLEVQLRIRGKWRRSALRDWLKGRKP